MCSLPPLFIQIIKHLNSNLGFKVVDMIVRIIFYADDVILLAVTMFVGTLHIAAEHPYKSCVFPRSSAQEETRAHGSVALMNGCSANVSVQSASAVQGMSPKALVQYVGLCLYCTFTSHTHFRCDLLHIETKLSHCTLYGCSCGTTLNREHIVLIWRSMYENNVPKNQRPYLDVWLRFITLPLATEIGKVRIDKYPIHYVRIWRNWKKKPIFAGVYCQIWTLNP